METNAANPIAPGSATQSGHDMTPHESDDHIQELSNKVTLPNPAQDIPFTIPAHIMGHDLNNPDEDMIGAGKRLHKPRLGVKVPSRHLSSQIVTQNEIVQELLERSLKKHPYSDPPEGDIFFAMKLTQRLANRIVPAPTPGSTNTEIKQEEKPALLDEHILPAGYTVNTDKTDIPDHSELLAILEGDTEPDLNPDVENDEATGKHVEQSAANSQSTNTTCEDNKLPINAGEKHPVIPLPPPKSCLQSRKRGPQYQLFKLYPELEKELALKQLEEVSRTPKPKLNKLNSNNVHSKSVGIKKKKHSENNNNVDKPGPTNEVTLKVQKKKRGRKRKADVINEEDSNKRYKLPKSNQRLNKKCKSKTQEKIRNISGRTEKLLNKEKSILKAKTKKKIQVKINKAKLTSKVPIKTLVNGSDLPLVKRKVGRPKLKESNAIITNETETIKEKVSPNINESSPKRTKVKKPSSRTMREINRLLGDEGAINMLYSIEQRRSPGSEPKRKVMLPSYRRKRKDLILKTKLVKNAVLRLSTTPPQKLGKNSLRHRSIENQEIKETPQRKMSTDSHDSHHSATHSSASKFAYPAKIAIPAEASRIIRRHSSSSSYSSSSNSPRRMSIDGDRSSLPTVFTPPFPMDELLSSDTSPEQMQETNTSADISSSPMLSNKSLVIMEVSERAERLINEKCKELNLRPDRTELLKKRIEYKKSITSSNLLKKNITPKIQPALDKKIPTSLIEGDVAKSNKKKIITPEMAEKTAALNSCLAETVLHFFNTSGTNTSSATPSTSTTVPPIFKKTPPLNLPASTVNNLSKITDTEKRRESEEKQRCSPRQNAAVLSFKEISLRRYDHLVQIILTPVSTKLKNALNVQVLRELISALNQLKKDESCRTVLLTSTGNVFCQGVDFASLIQHTPDKRKCAAVELAAAIKDFVKTLATFAKPIIAGVHGEAIGLGVTMLPLFDMVFASDKATFHTPYAKLGQIPEGAATITLPNMLGNTATSELLFACRKLTASEALHFGLVTRILWPDSFQEELIPLIRGIASQSSQSMDATKALLRKNLCSNLEDTLLSESHLLVQHWSSAECQANFKQFLEAEALTLQKQRENDV